ncbi:hypothetical protein [Streptomyces sp. NPDC058457]|uniref:hypothetical protein n=1 Tax=Streptomyces sp. NPDC058457 TaxID=3346507 RepID=UPI0036528314
MPNTYKRMMAGPVLVAVSAAAAGILLAGCSSDSDTAASSSTTAASLTGYQRALAHAKCMRSNGVSNYPDPKGDSSGHVMIEPGSGVDTTSQTYQKAEEKCQSLLPQGLTGGAAPGGSSGSLDSKKVAAWAACVRSHGVPKFQDPKVSGTQMIIDPIASGIPSPGDATFAKATAACQSKFPGGQIMLQAGGSQ